MSKDIAPPMTIANCPPAQRAEAVHRLYLINGSGLAFVPLLGAAFTWGMWGHVNSTALLTWYGAWLLTAPVWPWLLIRRYHAAYPIPLDQAGHWGRRMTWMNAAEGLLWGIAGMFFYVPDALPQQLLLLAFLIGKPAGSVFAASWWPPAFYANSLTAILPTVAAMFYRGTTEQLAIGFGLLVYLGGLHQVMRKAHGAAMETIALRFEKEELIAQLQQEKEIAERANLAKSKFLAAASHDLRQPLHALTLFVAAMEDKARYPETRDMVGNVQRCTTALESLLQTLLDISKIDAGVIEPRPEHFPLNPLVNRLVDEFTPQAKAAGLFLAAHCSAITVNSDPALVERILRNLIGNAIRYTPAGSVSILCRAENDRVTIEVRDTGSGIPPDQQERVFDEFVQLGNPERDRTKGLGLGLAIVRRLADLLDATVSLESMPGKGSTFRVTLPAGDSMGVAQQAADEMPLNALKGTIVATIDDEADVREGMRSLLESWGCRALSAEDAAGAITELDAAGLVPDIVLADYRLRNGATGVMAIQALRDHFRVDIPAAIVTGDTAPERLAEAQASGHLLLHKPLRPAKLRVLLQNLRHTNART